MAFDPSMAGYVPPGGGGFVSLGRRPNPKPPKPPAASVSLSAVTVGAVTEVTAATTGAAVDPTRITWKVTPAPDSSWPGEMLTGRTARFKHTAAAATVTATVPRTDGGAALTATLDVARSTLTAAGVFPRAYSWGEQTPVEASFGFATARTCTARLVRVASPGVASERTVIETRTVDFPANTAVVLSRTVTPQRPSGVGGGYEYVWEVDDAPGRVIASETLPVWVYGTGVARQARTAEPATVGYPAVYTRAASDSRRVTPATGRTYADHVTDFVGQWKATNLTSPTGGAWLGIDARAAATYWVNLDDPAVPRVTVDYWDSAQTGAAPVGWYGTDTAARPYRRDRVAVDVPIPTGAAPAPGTDRALTVVGLRGGKIERIWELGGAQKMADGGWRATTVGSTTAAEDWRHSAGYGPTAVGVSTAAHSLKVSEAQAAVDYIRAERAAGRTPSEDRIGQLIPHALAVDIPSPRAGSYSYPAAGTDGDNASAVAAWEGQLAYVRSDADITSQNLPPLTHAIAVTGKRYGFRVTGRTSWSTVLLVEDDRTYGGGIWSAILTAGESWALRFPDDWWVLGKQYPDKAGFDADTTRLVVSAVEDVPGQVLVTWTPAVTATVSRDGVDTTGDGPWTDTAVGQYRFQMLVPGDTYVFTVVTGDGATATTTLTTAVTTASTARQPAWDGATTWNLAWSDEFDGTTLNRTVWSPHRGLDWPYYTPYNPGLERLGFAENRISVANGALRLAWDKTTISTGGYTYPYTGGMVHSGRGFSFRHGFLECRMRVTATPVGLWPAFWLLSTPVDQDWPPEVDIVEMVASPQDVPDGLYHPHFNVHWGTPPNNQQLQWKWYGASGTNYVGTGWHTYGLLWRPGFMQVYVDGKPGPSYSGAGVPDSRDMYVILNTAVQEAKYGDPAASGSVEVDYVRWWDKEVTASQAPSPAPAGQTASAWNLTWSDEFDGTSLDRTTWMDLRGSDPWPYGTPYNPSMDDHGFAANRVAVSGGNLRLSWDSAPITVGGTTYGHTAGMVHSGPGFAFNKGFIEARIFIPDAGPGIWPAFWLLPKPVDDHWPPEIDIAEWVVDSPDGRNHPHVNVHWGTSADHQQWGWKWYGTSGQTELGGWHTYGLLWEDGRVQAFLDGVAGPEYIGPNLPTEDMYVVLNTGVMADKPATATSPAVTYDPAPGTMLVDYVRYWKPAATSGGVPGGGTTTPVQATSLLDSATTDLTAGSQWWVWTGAPTINTTAGTITLPTAADKVGVNNIPVTPGTQITVTVTPTSSSAGSSWVALSFFDAADVYIQSLGETGDGPGVRTATVTVPAGVTKCTIELRGSDGDAGTAVIDSVSLTQAAATPQITQQQAKGTALAVCSTAENSTVDWTTAYGYIEDIGDGRGYTAGIVGFCSGTGDMLALIENATTATPGNLLAKWLPQLRQVMAAPYADRPAMSASLLGSAYIADWKTAAGQTWFRDAQRAERDRVYWGPAKAQADRDGVGVLGLTILYDISVNHGPGSDSGSFGGIVATAQSKAKPPSAGGSETSYLTALIDAREAVLKSWGDWQATGRQAAHRHLLTTNPSMRLPVSWPMYGTTFTLTAYPSEGDYTSGTAAPQGGVSGYDQAVLADGPAFFLADGVKDSAGGATVARKGTLSTAALPDGSAATRFPGKAGAYLEVPSSQATQIGPLGALTVEAWIIRYTDAVGITEDDGSTEGLKANFMGVLNYGSTNQVQWEWRTYAKYLTSGAVASRNNRWSTYAFNPGGGLGTGSYYQGGVGSMTSIPYGQAFHLVAVYDDTQAVRDSNGGWGRVQLYLNGKLWDTDSFGNYSTRPQYVNAPLRIGTSDLVTYSDLAIGKVATYKRALTSAQIDAHYKAMATAAPATSTAVKWPEGSTNNGWLVEYDGYGYVQKTSTGSVEMQPQYVASASTSACLVTSTATTSGDMTLKARMRTIDVRPGANPWECAWLYWGYSRVASTAPAQGVDNTDGWARRCYYLALKPNGYELGKLDQQLFVNSGGQRYLSDNSTPVFPVGRWYDVEVRQVGGSITVLVDGVQITSFTDGPGSSGWMSGEQVYTSGGVGLYCEDSHVEFTNVTVTAGGTTRTLLPV